jgi:hypothetical protein
VSDTRTPKPPQTIALAIAEDATLASLEQRNYADACRVVAIYEAKRPIPRGIGVRWEQKAHDRNPSQAVALRSIFETPSPAADDVRMAAAMMFLWGASSPRRRWLARERNGDALALQLVLSAYAALRQENDRRGQEMLRR